MTNSSGLVASLSTSIDLGTLTVVGFVPLLHHKFPQSLFLIWHRHNHFHSQEIQIKVVLMMIQGHLPLLVSSPQHVLCTNLEDILDVTLNMADVMSKDVFEELQLYSDQCSRATNPNQGRINGLNAAAIPELFKKDLRFDIVEDILPQINQLEAELDDPNTTSTVVINRFLSGRVGAPIPNMPRRASAHESAQDIQWAQKPLQCLAILHCMRCGA